MHFRILYCKPCRYRERADELATELRSRFGAEVDVEEGAFGQFDVILDGELVASKGGFWLRKIKHGPPTREAIRDAIERALAGQEGEACELPRPELRSTD